MIIYIKYTESPSFGVKSVLVHCALRHEQTLWCDSLDFIFRRLYLRDFNDWTEKYPTPYPIAENADIDILLGVPQVHFINYRQTEHPEIDQQGTAPVAIHTKFGSAISAPKWPVENSNIHNTTMTDGSLGNLTFFSALDGIDLAQ